MKKVLAALLSCVVICLFLVTQGLAHTPLCTCYDNGDGTITCEGGFSDGSSGAGVKMVVKDKGGNELISGRMDEDSEFTFKKPDAPYVVIFDAGPGHVVEIKGKDITE